MECSLSPLGYALIEAFFSPHFRMSGIQYFYFPQLCSAQSPCLSSHHLGRKDGHANRWSVQGVCVLCSFRVRLKLPGTDLVLSFCLHIGEKKKFGLLNVSCNCTQVLPSWKLGLFLCSDFLILVFITWRSDCCFRMMYVVSHDWSLLCFIVSVLLVFFKSYFVNRWCISPLKTQ